MQLHKFQKNAVGLESLCFVRLQKIMRAKILIIILLVLFLVIGYSNNLNSFIWSWGRPSLFNFIYSCVYLASWLLLLVFAVKKKLEGLQKVYLVFWILSVILALEIKLLTATYLAALILVASLAFIVPLIGIVYPFNILSDILEIAFVDSTNILIVVSLTMFLIGYFVRKSILIGR